VFQDGDLLWAAMDMKFNFQYSIKFCEFVNCKY
jgi:hypothetical protein